MLKLVKYLKDMGRTSDEIQTFGTLIQPIIARFVENLYLSTFSNQELDNLRKVALRENFSPLDEDELMVKAYKEKTGRAVDQEIQEYLDSIVDDLTTTQTQVLRIINKYGKLPEAEFIKEFEIEMNVMERKYLDSLKNKNIKQ
jgi:hypothetical protein